MPKNDVWIFPTPARSFEKSRGKIHAFATDAPADENPTHEGKGCGEWERGQLMTLKEGIKSGETNGIHGDKKTFLFGKSYLGKTKSKAGLPEHSKRLL